MTGESQTPKTFNEFVDYVNSYFNSLNQIELIAWALIGFGLILLILGFVFI